MQDTTELTPVLLISAYSRGYFPMPDPDTEEILWFHPDPRAIIPLDKFHVSRSLRRSLRNKPYTLTINKAFKEVMEACAARPDTWINDEIFAAYTRLHREGFAHSVEAWWEDQLVGGLYGVSLAGGFFAESKFHTMTDASKIALHHLIEHMKSRDMNLLEVQFMTEHLRTLGAVEVSRAEYLKLLNNALETPTSFID